MAWGEPEEDEDVYGEVGKALADPAGTYAGENSEVPEETPTIKDGSPSTVQSQRDDNRADDEEVNYMAGDSGRQQMNELAETDVPESVRSGMSTPPDDGAVTSTEGDAGDGEAAALAGSTETYKAPPPLSLTPYADHSADEQALVAQKAKENPAKYKPSIFRRIGAGLAGGMVAAGTRNSGEGMNVGLSVLHGPLDHAKEEWAAQEAPLKQKIEADRAADQQVTRANAQATAQHSAAVSNLTTSARVNEWNAMAQQRKAQAQAKLNTVDRNTIGPVDPNNPFGEWQGKTPSGQVVRGLEPPAAVQKSPAFIMHQRMNDIAQMQAMGIKMTPKQKSHYLAGDKTLGDATEHTSISIRENPDGSAVQPGAGRGGPHTQNISDTVAKATQDKEVFAGQWHRIADEDEAKTLGAPVGSYVNGTKTMNPDEFKAHIDKFRTDANVKLNKYGAHLDEQGQLHTEPGQPQLTPGGEQQQQAQPAQQQQQPATQGINQFPVGQKPGTRNVKGPGGLSLDLPEKSLPDIMSGKLKIQGNKGETLVFKNGQLVLEQKKK